MFLSDREIYDIAGDLVTRVKDYLNDTWYEHSDVSLQIGFKDSKAVNAEASVWPLSGKQVRHKITLTYRLVEYIYAEAVDFALFASRKHDNVPISIIPEQFDVFTASEFMFESGIVFIIFHELAHINQNHGIIRQQYGSLLTSIAEFGESDAKSPIPGTMAGVFHATEFAADYEAQNWMANFLNFQFSGIDFVNHAFLQCAIVSCIMFLFNGDCPRRLDSMPKGTHPYPIPRMDLWVKSYIERIMLLKKPLKLTDTSDVFKMLHDAPFLAALKWMTRNELPDTDEYNSVVNGIFSHDNHQGYMQIIINIWSEICPFARDQRRYDIGVPLSVLYFSDEYRDYVGAVKNEHTLKEHMSSTLKATKNN